MSRRHAVRIRAVYVILVALAVAWAAVTVWALRPYDNITFTPFQTDREVYAPGDIITLTNTFCWDGTPFTATRVLVKPVSESELGVIRFPNGFALPSVAEEYADDGCNDSTVRVQIPPTQPPGVYSIRYEVRYKPPWNPVRVVEVDNTSNQFTITPNPELTPTKAIVEAKK